MELVEYEIHDGPQELVPAERGSRERGEVVDHTQMVTRSLQRVRSRERQRVGPRVAAGRALDGDVERLGVDDTDGAAAALVVVAHDREHE